MRSQSNLAGYLTLPIIDAVARRIHVLKIFPGEIPLDAQQAHHARDVLRLSNGAMVELFDDAGNVASGELIVSGQALCVRVGTMAPASPRALELTIAAAVPKGERADWMVEKLSELGVAEFIPLAAERSVVLPEGKNKRQRWQRIATESAKQSRRAGVMRIGELTRVDQVLGQIGQHTSRWFFSTAPDASPILDLKSEISDGGSIIALIGPEGGWSGAELVRFAAAGLTAVKLSATVLRVETAAIAAAAIIECTLNA